AGVPPRLTPPRVPNRPRRWLHRHRRIEPGGTPGRGRGKRRPGQRSQHQDHQTHRYGAGAPVRQGRGSLSEYRTGLGWDVHRLEPGRPLILGGVRTPYEFGLAGHSDADILAHAITDAVLGAAALGDIGMHFPDSDPRWKGADSLQFLAAAREMAAKAGF